MAEAAAIGTSNLPQIPSASKDLAIVVPKVANIRLTDVLDVLCGNVDPADIVFADTMGPRTFLIFFKTEVAMMTAVGYGTLSIGPNVCVPISPFVRSQSKIYLKKVPPFIPLEIVEESLLPFGKVISIINTNARFNRETYKHICSFGREAIIELKGEKSSLPKSVSMLFEGRSYNVEIDTVAQRCYNCNGTTHFAGRCPTKNIGRPQLVPTRNQNVRQREVQSVNSQSEQGHPRNVPKSSFSQVLRGQGQRQSIPSHYASGSDDEVYSEPNPTPNLPSDSQAHAWQKVKPRFKRPRRLLPHT